MRNIRRKRKVFRALLFPHRAFIRPHLRSVDDKEEREGDEERRQRDDRRRFEVVFFRLFEDHARYRLRFAGDHAADEDDGAVFSERARTPS